METKDPHSDEGTGESEPSNVVLLPRDWFGPRDELVPFGPRATGASVADSDRTASDFWSEDSAAVHEVVQVGADEGGAGGVEPASPVVDMPGGARRVRRPRLPKAHFVDVLRSRAAVLVAAGLAAVAFAAIGLAQLGGSAGIRMPPGGQSASSSALPLEPAAVGLRSIISLIRSLAPERTVARGARDGARRPHASASRGTTPPVVHHGAQAQSPAVPAAAMTASSASGSAGSGASSAGPSAGSGAATSPGGSGTTSQPAGPVGPGAPFGPGTLG